MSCPPELRYTKSHEWVRAEKDGRFTVGITEHAQHLLGDLVYVELPEFDSIKAGKEAGVVESVKAASDIYMPMNGEVVEVNEALRSDPGLINHDPYHSGWIFRIIPQNAAEREQLLDAKTYQAEIGE